MSNSNTKAMNVGSGRVEYIDAMRGLAIVMVLTCHAMMYATGFFSLETFTYTTSNFSFSALFEDFVLALFFFISGYVVSNHNLDWRPRVTFRFLKGRFVSFIVAPLLFMLLYIILLEDGDVVGALQSPWKGGYWFTIVLFVSYALYALLLYVARVLRLNGIWEDLFLLVVAFVVSMPCSINALRPQVPEGSWFNILMVERFVYFFYLVLGTRTRKYSASFERLLDNKVFITVGLLFAVFVMPFLLPLEKTTPFLYENVIQVIALVVWIFLFFQFFRHNSSVFSSTHRVGRVMTFVGRRTLDIYFLHYFFLMTDMPNVLPNFAVLNSPFLSFVVELLVALLLVAVSLLVSWFLRLSPIVAHLLFNEKLSSHAAKS